MSDQLATNATEACSGLLNFCEDAIKAIDRANLAPAADTKAQLRFVQLVIDRARNFFADTMIHAGIEYARVSRGAPDQEVFDVLHILFHEAADAYNTLWMILKTNECTLEEHPASVVQRLQRTN